MKGILTTYSCESYGLKHSDECLTLDPRQRQANECSEGHTVDYFVGSEFFFVTTFVFLASFVVSIILLLKILVYRKNCQSESIRVKASKLRRMTISDNTTLAQEWVGDNDSYRSVEVILNNKNKSIKVRSENGDRVLRAIYLRDASGKVWMQCNHNKAQDHILMRLPKEYDLVLKFDSYYEREKFIAKLETFFMELGIAQDRHTQELSSMFKFAYTKLKRQAHLEVFFRVVFSHVSIAMQFAFIIMPYGGLLECILLQKTFFCRLSTRRPEKTLT